MKGQGHDPHRGQRSRFPRPDRGSLQQRRLFQPAALLKMREECKDRIDFTDIAQKKLTLKMWQFDKPVIAAVNGLVVGGAFTLCLSCADLIYVSEHAWAQLPFVNIGIIRNSPPPISCPTPGFQRAKELIYFAERIPAQQLSSWGWLTRFSPTTS